MKKLLPLLLSLGLIIAACGAESPSDAVSSAGDEASTTTQADPGTDSTVPEDDYGFPEDTADDTDDGEDDYGFRDAEDDTTSTTYSEGEGDVARDDRPPTTKRPEQVPPSDSAPVTGEVPGSMMDEILAHAAELAGGSVGDFTIIRAQQVVFNDGSLGCPEPGVYYTQATVDGYWVVLSHDGYEYDYRVTGNGAFRLCEAGTPPTTTPDS